MNKNFDENVNNEEIYKVHLAYNFNGDNVIIDKIFLKR